jgi:hypothetical protein
MLFRSPESPNLLDEEQLDRGSNGRARFYELGRSYAPKFRRVFSGSPPVLAVCVALVVLLGAMSTAQGRGTSGTVGTRPALAPEHAPATRDQTSVGNARVPSLPSPGRPPPSASQSISPVYGPVSSSCFGGSGCQSTGTTCTISNFPASAGYVLYVATTYSGAGSLFSSVTDSIAGGGADSFVPITSGVSGSSSPMESAFWYGVSSELGGTATITVTLTSSESGICTAGQLAPGTVWDGPYFGSNAMSSGSSLTVSVNPQNPPSLILALFGASRPQGAPIMNGPSGTWQVETQLTGTTYSGNGQQLYAYDANSAAGFSFDWQTGNGQLVFAVGVVGEFTAGIPTTQGNVATNCFGGSPCTSTSSSSSAGSGQTCTISNFGETAGDLMFLAVDFDGVGNAITGISDNLKDSFAGADGTYLGYGEGVDIYYVASEVGGTATIKVQLASSAYGSCMAGQLPAGTTLGVSDANSVSGTSSLSVGVTTGPSPSYILGFFGGTRPTGTPTYSVSGATAQTSTLTIGSQETGYSTSGGAVAGSNAYLYGFAFNPTGSYTNTPTPTVNFAWATGNGQVIDTSGVEVQFSGPEIGMTTAIPASGSTATSADDCVTSWATNLVVTAIGWHSTASGTFYLVVWPLTTTTFSFYPASGCTNLASQGSVTETVSYDSKGAIGEDVAWSVSVGVQDVWGYNYAFTVQYLENVYSDGTVYGALTVDSQYGFSLSALIEYLQNFLAPFLD